ncbi:metal ABC transporter solute-binding protein, Zn/Mn family [Alcanivoracaceae bacterium MT1]
MKYIKYLSYFIVFMFILTACVPNNQDQMKKQSNNKLNIYTTIYPLQFFTEKIGGNQVILHNVVPPGVDAHSVDITSKTMVDMAKSAAYIHTGTNLESFTSTIIKALEKDEVLIVNASEGIHLLDTLQGNIEHEEEEEGHEDHGDTDPHVWVDPIRAIQIAENITNALIILAPEHKEYFETNYLELKEELETLDQEFQAMVNEAKTKTFVVSHAAYGYWEDAYQLKQIGISGLSPTSEPSQKQLIEIIELVRSENINYIFFEPNLSNKVAKTVQYETEVDSLTLHNLESLTDDDIQRNKDYFTIMRENIGSLQQALH